MKFIFFVTSLVWAGNMRLYWYIMLFKVNAVHSSKGCSRTTKEGNPIVHKVDALFCLLSLSSCLTGKGSVAREILRRENIHLVIEGSTLEEANGVSIAARCVLCVSVRDDPTDANPSCSS